MLYEVITQQRLLADWFGSSLWARALAMLSGLVVTAVAIFAISWLTRKREKVDPLLQAYQQACQKIARKYGLVRLREETPAQFLSRVKQTAPAATDVLLEITHCYLAARYRPKQNTKAARQQIRRLTRQL